MCGYTGAARDLRREEFMEHNHVTKQNNIVTNDYLTSTIKAYNKLEEICFNTFWSDLSLSNKKDCYFSPAGKSESPTACSLLFGKQMQI